MAIPIAWLSKLKRGEITQETIKSMLEQLGTDDWATLDKLMSRIIFECPMLEVMPAKGYKPFAFHVQVPNLPPPFVYVAIVPRLKAGIQVLARRRLIGFEKGSDNQLPWRKTISSDEDIDMVIKYCKGLQ
jgi:hypothetical protein